MSQVLIFNPYWATLGGGERYVAAFARLMLSYGWHVDILSPVDYSNKIRDRFGLDLSGVNWLDASYNPLMTIPYSLLFWLSDGSLPVSFSPKTVIHLQFPFRDVGGGSPVNFIKSRFYTFVVNSTFTKSFVDPEYHVQSRVIYPPVNTADFTSGKKQKLILYVGRFSKLTQAKGQQVLIEVFKRIYQQIPGWKLVLAGGTAVGTRPEDLRGLKAAAAGLPVRIITDPSYPEIKKLFGQADIFWSASGFGINEKTDPTRVEHFGISLVEAMAAGAVPVITGLGGHREIITDHEEGFFWQTPEELGDITLKLVSDPGSLVKLRTSAVLKSKMFDISCFNSAFSRLLSL